MILSARNITKKYADKWVLDGVILELHEGETLVVVGRSGGGKSTLLKILAGLEDADDGEVFFRGKRVVGPSLRLVAGHPEIKLVNQDFALDKYHTVEENIRLKVLHYQTEDRDEIVEELITVMGLESLRKKQAYLLSGGEQQRLALARALANEPDILLLDEPFVHLDPLTRRRVELYIHEMRSKWNTTIILVTHDGKEAMAWGDHIAYMEDGVIKRVDSAVNFYIHPTNSKEAQFFGEINVIHSNGRERLFRPDAYSIVADGVEVEVLKTAFQGGYFSHLVRTTASEEELVLYASSPLPQKLMIEPDYAKE